MFSKLEMIQNLVLRTRQQGGADAAGSAGGASPRGGLRAVALKKPVNWPGTSARTL